MPLPTTRIVSDGPVLPTRHAWGESLAGIVCSRCGVAWSTEIAADTCVDPHADTMPIDIRIDSEPTRIARHG